VIIEQDPEECIHGIWPASSCTRCNGRDKLAAQLDLEPVATFPAKYSGQCSTCHCWWAVGDLITKLGDSGRYVHARCAP
jgi:hypothetical protein